jgi:hypothetical protein
MSLQITTYCHIRNNSIVVNGEVVFRDPEKESLKSFLVAAFKHKGIKYPKFYKMDDISKLGFLCAELLLMKKDIQKDTDKVGLVLSNSHATLVTDANFQESINDYDNFYPSPAVFVYTLPNIMMGEISIRHKLRGENAFFIFDRFNAGVVSDYINQLYENGKLNCSIGGWVDQSQHHYEAFMYWAEPIRDTIVAVAHEEREIEKIYSLK